MSGTPVTVVIEYTIDASKLAEFELYSRRWVELVRREGGVHHGYFLPSEGASDKALALFTFESFSAYEAYRAHFGVDPDFMAADRLRTDTGCVIRWDRTMMRPLRD
ncbi:NIPSNAP family protein [Jannaschia sp. R86511]|uniref:NIPSNAP family protein n=1 Tax=Jannaschia sp. R86511 TaxID=3093853 RepID=UPI0036D296E3